ncbi:MAG: hypothetical protein H6Q15_1436 [Bacteroidetes bacterium]|nr:hypothetical protein [Bacteroidota bacterium]
MKNTNIKILYKKTIFEVISLYNNILAIISGASTLKELKDNKETLDKNISKIDSICEIYGQRAPDVCKDFNKIKEIIESLEQSHSKNIDQSQIIRIQELMKKNIYTLNSFLEQL